MNSEWAIVLIVTVTVVTGDWWLKPLEILLSQVTPNPGHAYPNSILLSLIVEYHLQQLLKWPWWPSLQRGQSSADPTTWQHPHIEKRRKVQVTQLSRQWLNSGNLALKARLLLLSGWPVFWQKYLSFIFFNRVALSLALRNQDDFSHFSYVDYCH